MKGATRSTCGVLDSLGPPISSAFAVYLDECHQLGIDRSRIAMRDSTGPVELSETALKLSKVIEREARRRSELHSSRKIRLQSHFPSFSRMKTVEQSQRSQRSVRSRRSMSVTPTPEEPTIVTTVEGSSPELPAVDLSNGTKGTLTRQCSKTVSESQADDGEEPTSCMHKVWVFFEDPQSSTPAYYFSLSIYGFIILSTFVFVAETEAVFDPYMSVLNALEAICAGVFSFELVGRFLVCPSKLVFLQGTPLFIH